MKIRPPATFSGLLDQINLLENVRFTGDRKPVLRLDRLSGRRQRAWAQRTWEALTALDTYAHEKRDGATGNFWTHCCAGRTGMSQHQYSRQESPTTMNRWGSERRFPVPASVDPTGEAVMEAHIRIGRQPPAPRVYFLDRVDHGDGVLVGWIGPHLTNTRT